MERSKVTLEEYPFGLPIVTRNLPSLSIPRLLGWLTSLSSSTSPVTAILACGITHFLVRNIIYTTRTLIFYSTSLLFGETLTFCLKRMSPFFHFPTKPHMPPDCLLLYNEKPDADNLYNSFKLLFSSMFMFSKSG